jgi:hypothetical protein
MNQRLTLEQRITLARQRLMERRQDLSRHRLQLRFRVVSELRASPVSVVAGVALLAWGWYATRKSSR